MSLPLGSQRVASGGYREVISPRGHESQRTDVVVGCQPNLFQVVGAAHAVGGLAYFLYGGYQQTNQNCDDGDNHQKLN